ncbi:MAG: carbon-nitrogen hydrolase family protein [Planctomycetaceae bacterium]
MSRFRIAAAQVVSVRGDIAANLRGHAAAIASAGEQEVSVLIFPELSLTGYEPDLASELAITCTDERLMPLATLARQHQMAVVVGAPIKNFGAKPSLGAILFGPDGSMSTYAKMHLGGSEPEFFKPGEVPLSFTTRNQTVGLAICADSSKPSHPKFYVDDGSSIYAAGVFLNSEWYQSDSPRLGEYASRHQMLVVMANHAASVGTYVSVGKSAIWAPDGCLVAEAPGTESSLVISTQTDQKWIGEVVLL